MKSPSIVVANNKLAFLSVPIVEFNKNISYIFPFFYEYPLN